MRTQHRTQTARAPNFCCLLAILAASALQCAQAAGWAGRPLLDVIAELRDDGLQLLYSTQVVTPDLRIAAEPRAVTDAARLREVLQPLGLDLQRVEDGGYAIVRAVRDSQAEHSANTAAAAAPLEEITVFASRYSVTRQEDPAALNVSQVVLQKSAGVEADALRALHYFPGAASNNLSALTHVRGGSESETLIQFDGVELYRPTHLKDFQSLFGLIDPELVQSMDYFSGGFPARYGNHNSGVIDIQPRRTNTTRNMVGASVLYGRAMSSGSFADDRGAWLAGYRRSTLPAVLRQLESKVGEPEFDDFVGRIEYEFGRNKVAAGALWLGDDLHLFTSDATEQTSAHYQDLYLWFNLQRAWSEHATSRWQISSATLDSSRHANVAFESISSGTLEAANTTRIGSAQMLWDVAANSTTGLEFGVRSDHSTADYRHVRDSQFFAPLAQTFARDATQTTRFEGTRRGDFNSAHTSLRSGYGRLSGELGLRWDDYTYIDAQRFSPRLSLRYALSAASSLRFSAGRYVQAETLNELDIAQDTPGFRTPESSRQFIVGFDHRFDSRMQLRIEAYAKHNSHVRPYYENLLDNLTLGAELGIDWTLVEPQNYTARGVEISLRSDPQAALNWSVSYTRSQARDRIADSTVLRSWDQPHAFNATFAWSRQRWQYSGAFTWHSGWPYTPLIIESRAGGDVAVLGARNSQRYNDFASLDLRAQYTLPLQNSSFEFFFEARNALNRSNNCCRDVTVTENPNGSYSIGVEQEAGLTFVPLAGINWRF